MDDKVHSRITVTIDTDRALTGSEQAGLIHHIECGLIGPVELQVNEAGDAELVPANWSGEYDIIAEFPN